MSYSQKDIFKKIVGRRKHMSTKEIGDFGENCVVEYIKKSGYEVIEKNYHTRFGEIDIIAKDKECTVFIEVKTRKSSLYGNASEYVNPKKQEKIIKSALSYLKDIENTEIRFDVAEVYYIEKNNKFLLKEINYIENAFLAEGI